MDSKHCRFEILGKIGKCATQNVQLLQLCLNFLQDSDAMVSCLFHENKSLFEGFFLYLKITKYLFSYRN